MVVLNDFGCRTVKQFYGTTEGEQLEQTPPTNSDQNTEGHTRLGGHCLLTPNVLRAVQ